MEKRKIIPYLIVIAFALLGGWSLLHEGFPPTHDGEYHIMRFWQFNKVLFEGNIYPRWAPDFNNGFGIPLFTYQYPLPNYISAMFSVLGVSLIDSFKYSLLAAHIIGAIAFYAWGRRFFGTIGALTSSIFYSFAPYRFLDIYVRGSVGEVWALAFFPAFLWSITSYLEKPSRLQFVLAILFLALTIYSHNILGLAFFTFGITYSIIFLSAKKREYWYRFAAIIIIGLGFTTPFVLPALFERNLVRGLEVFSLNFHFPQLYELLIPSWGTGFSGINSANQMSFQIGVMNLIVIFAVSLLIFIKRKRLKNFKIALFMVMIFLVTFFLMLQVSESVWRSIPLMNYFQFPWRLLSVVIIVCAFLSGVLVDNLSSTKKQVIWGGLFCFLLILSTYGYSKPAYYHDRADEHYLTRDNFTDGTNSIGNVFNTKWLSDIPPKQDKAISVVEGDVKILSLEENSSRVEARIYAVTNAKLQVHRAYFPHWKGYLNANEIRLHNDRGVIAVEMPEGTHLMRIELETSYIQKVSYALFFVSIILLIILTTKIAIIKK